MSKEYKGHITSSQAFYSNLNSYGCANNCKTIVPPIPVESYPTLFSNAIPHSLPDWMNPKVNQSKSEHCVPYNSFYKTHEKCNRF